MKAILLALMFAGSANAATYKPLGIVTLPNGQRVVIVERRQPRQPVVYRQTYPTPPMASPRRAYIAPPVAEPIPIENPYFK